MIKLLRQKSPRAPSLSLDDSIVRIMKVYERERLHPAPTEVVAQHLGYKSANNGSALSALASLRYFGLLERPKEGLLAVTKEVESFKFAPDERMKHSLLVNFLKRPALYNELLEKYASGLPSDANLKFELIQRGFAPQSADAAVALFRKSVTFAEYYNQQGNEEIAQESEENPEDLEENNSASESENIHSQKQDQGSASQTASIHGEQDSKDLDRIPVRLPGGRRAWLLIPTPFYNADKERIKAQIDLLLTKEEELEN